MTRTPPLLRSLPFAGLLALFVSLAARGPLPADEPTPDTTVADRLPQKVTALLDAYLEAFNRRDAAAWSRTLNYPHVRIAGGQVKVWNTADDYALDFDFAKLTKEQGWSHSRWDHRRVIHAAADKLHLDVRFTRYRQDGTPIASYDAVYVVTLVEGHWGVQARSSFAP